jgi:hypothetical protein
VKAIRLDTLPRATPVDVLALLLIFAFCAALLLPAQRAEADASAVPLGTDTFAVAVSLGDFSAAATTADAAVVTLPANCKVLGISASAGTSSGTEPTLTVDVELGTTDIIADPIAVTAGASAYAASVTDTDLAAESVLHFDAVVGGTNPVFTEVQALVFCARY